MKLICKCGNTFEIQVENFRKEYPFCNTCGGRFIFYCYSCNDYLYGKPKICFENHIYCFSCAKKAIKYQEELLNNEYQKLKKDYDKQYCDWSRVRDNICHEQTNWIIPMGLIIAAVVPVYLLGKVGIGLAIVTVLTAIPFLIMVRAQVFFKKQQRYSVSSPPPQCPSRHYLDCFLLPFDGYFYDTNNYRAEIIKRDHSICQNCNHSFEHKDIEVHHIIPKSKSGDDHPSNLITLCFECHKKENWFGHKHYYRELRKII